MTFENSNPWFINISFLVKSIISVFSQWDSYLTTKTSKVSNQIDTYFKKETKFVSFWKNNGHLMYVSFKRISLNEYGCVMLGARAYMSKWPHKRWCQWNVTGH